MRYRDDLIRAEMGRLRKTNYSLAKETGVGHQTISKIRNGHSTVGLLAIQAVCRALGLKASEVVILDEEEKPRQKVA